MNAQEMKAALFATEDLKPTRVLTPEWAPGLPHVYVRSLTADELVSLRHLTDTDHEMRTVAALAMCTEDGESLGFTEMEIVLLGKKHAGPVKRSYDAAMQLCGLGDEAKDELLGNSSAAASDADG
jgi:hypothetical protein